MDGSIALNPKSLMLNHSLISTYFALIIGNPGIIPRNVYMGLIIAGMF